MANTTTKNLWTVADVWANDDHHKIIPELLILRSPNNKWLVVAHGSPTGQLYTSTVEIKETLISCGWTSEQQEQVSLVCCHPNAVRCALRAEECDFLKVYGDWNTETLVYFGDENGQHMLREPKHGEKVSFEFYGKREC